MNAEAGEGLHRGTTLQMSDGWDESASAWIEEMANDSSGCVPSEVQERKIAIEDVTKDGSIQRFLSEALAP